MEKRALIAIALAFLVLLAWQYLFPPPEKPPAPPAGQEQVAPGEPEDERPRPEPEEAEAVEELPAELPSDAVVAEAEEEVLVETDLFRVVLTNRGARARSWQLREYQTREGGPLETVPHFVDGADTLTLGIDLDDGRLAREANEALYQVERTRLRPRDGQAGGERVRFRWADGRGVEVVKEMEFRDGTYLVGLDVEVTDRGRALPVRLTLGPGFETRGSAGGRLSYYYSGQALWNLAGRAARERKVSKEPSGSGPLLWAGLEDQYFAALIVPRDGQGSFRVRPVEVTRPVAAGEGEEAGPEQQPVMEVTVSDEGAFLFVGPKHYNKLRRLGYDLQDAVWFSSVSLFALMARLLYQVLVWLHGTVVANYGLAIILTTLMLRIALFPLNQFSMVRMKKMQNEMQRIQPKINAVKNKYRKKKDAEGRTQMNQELMALYKKEGVNPMGGMSGCLPLLIQFPILIGFYDMLLAAVELRGAPFFGWIQDLTLKDPFYVTPILMGVTMFLQQKMSMAKGGDPTQQRIMMMTPVIFTVMFLNLPSGLVLYWFVNNVLGIGQQWLVNRHLGKMAKVSQKAKA